MQGYLNASPLQNWIPFALDVEKDLVSWIYTGGVPFSAPFFEDTLSACKQHVLNKSAFASTSNVAFLTQCGTSHCNFAPTAIIFHVSRCGSTLVTQLLNCDPQNLTLAEVPFFDDILRANSKNHSLSAAGRRDLLLAAFQLHAAAQPSPKNVYIKCDSWHIHFYEFYRKVFPHTPFLLLYREPAAVLASHQKQRGMQSVPGLLEPELFGLDSNQINPADLDGYLLQVLESYFYKMQLIASNDKNVFLFNYKNGIKEMVSFLYTLQGRRLSEEIISKMDNRLLYHSKKSNLAFVEERQIPAHTKLMGAKMLYENLENLSGSLQQV